ncbi:uncharacterized protein [Spinacia oleracea]|uniref:Transposase-associated domain-containing protein n=1 Tax=Spinacia oleracea TaxID=3562 RepID=A0ABM3R3C0_SPIOL|nr:uncharacterized protein LOC110805392 [Spinacia oleracea]
MDRKWMLARRTSDEYEKRVEEFIIFAIDHAEDPSRILCPCINCNNMVRHNVEDVRIHLVVNGIIQTYKCWIKHGETLEDFPSYVSNEMYGEMYGDTENDETEADEMEEDLDVDRLEEMTHILGKNIEGGSEMFETLSNDAKTPLYPGCTKFSKLSAVLKLYNLKARGGVPDDIFTGFLKLVKEMLPAENVLPDRNYEARKMLSSVGMGYEKIHACPNDCILYRKEYASLENCPECNTPRYKNKKVPSKVMWYFPIVPRFRRLFSIAEEAKKLTWHADERLKDGLLRHPADSPQWIKIDNDFEDFGSEDRNLRLALAADGMNPFGNQSCNHSTWPVILMIYNLCPDLIMKRKWKKAFNGEIEEGTPPVPPSGDEILEKMQKLDVKLGKLNAKNVPSTGHKKLSIFFDLSYWRTLHVRHFLDVMHIEKNVCESLISTLLNVPSKTKDGEASRLDLVDLGIRAELAPIKRNSRTYLPPACYTLSRKEKIAFCECLYGVKVPEGYSPNIKTLVSMKNLKLIGLKSHDYHILMEHLLPLEMYFPPSFFDIMIHLTVHLVREVQLCGPAYLRYMYAVERFMKILKDYVHSGSRPEGCIVERTLIEEALEFCIHYLSNVDAIGLPKPRDPGGFQGKGIVGKKVVSLSHE